MKTRTLHQQFRDAYHNAKSKHTLGYLADWPVTSMARTMNADVVRATPRMATRLSLLAESLHYTGPLFSDEVVNE